MTPHGTTMTTSHANVDSLSQFQPEASDLLARLINTLDALNRLKLFKYETKRVPESIACCPPLIASLKEDLVPRLPDGGSLLCMRAGHIGLLGFIDYSKLPTTLALQGDRALTCIAPGSEAIIKGQEVADNSQPHGSNQRENLQISSKGVFLSVSSSGRVFLVLHVPQIHSRKDAATTWINLEAEPSTIGRMKAAQFISPLLESRASIQILHTIQTCIIIKMAKTYYEPTIDMCATSHRCKARYRRIIGQVYRILQKNGHVFGDTIHDPYLIEDSTLNILIRSCGGNIKLACAVAVSGLPLDVARRRFDLVNGNFHSFVDSLRLAIIDQDQTYSGYPDGDLFLAIDGGGTKCAVSIASRTGILARAHAGAGNFHSVPIDVLLDNIQSAVMKAVSLISEGSWPQRPMERPRFAAVWAGLAGLQHANRRESLARSLEQLFGVSVKNGTLRLSSDSELLSAHIGLDDSVVHGISLIAGTGSVATAFKQDPNGDVLQIGRAGGWGSLLGDQGSAFDIGKQVVQALLTSLESSQGLETDCLSELEREVLASLGHRKEGLLSRILFPEADMKKAIAGLARVVTRLAFRTEYPDPQALEILTSAARSLAGIVRPLAKKQICDPAISSLILSGSLMKIPGFQELVLSELSRGGICSFKNMVIVDDASSDAALLLARQTSRTS